VDVVHPRCCGVDVSKRDAKVCVRVAGAGRRKTTSTVTTWGAVTNQVLALRDHLIAEAVTLVVMEATSDYWKPFYYLLEDGPWAENLTFSPFRLVVLDCEIVGDVGALPTSNTCGPSTLLELKAPPAFGKYVALICV